MPINNAMHSLSSQTNGIGGGEHGERHERGVKMLRAGSNINQLTKYAISKHLLFEGPKHKKENMSFWKQATVLEISRNIFGISSYGHFIRCIYTIERFLLTMTILLVVGNSMYKNLDCSWQLNVQNSHIHVRIVGVCIPNFTNSLQLPQINASSRGAFVGG